LVEVLTRSLAMTLKADKALTIRAAIAPFAGEAATQVQDH